ncbi:hypothetical protein [Dyella sp. ASV21]|jgi:hypothetical protein|uniref:hypothetical protein n=1 Tax=Dyella sp. ASV21 TaxID=2795114 RepID=UPI0018ECD425|nr:hypothetical protein [Dyella sp. ASV21]
MKWLAPLLCTSLLAACSGKPPTPAVQPASASTARVATPWDDLKKDEQRARDVQKVVNQQAEKQREQAEAANQ